MKKALLVIIYLKLSVGFTQQKDSLNYQFKVNIYPLLDKGYGSAFNFGFETRQKYINYGIDFFTYNEQLKVQDKYRFDTLMHRKRIDSNFYSSGLAFNLSKKLTIKGTNNRIIIGAQVIIGNNRNYSVTYNETYDSIYDYFSQGKIYKKAKLGWINDKQYSSRSFYDYGDYKKYNAGLSLGFAFFFRLEFQVYKRFTFAPEVKLPIIYTNKFRNGIASIDFNPGISFNLAYKFGKKKPTKKPKVKWI